MSPENVRAASDVLPVVEGVDPSTAASAGEYLAVSGLVAIPITHVNASVRTEEDLEFRDEGGAQLGTICFSRRLIEVDPSTLTRWQYVAYLADVSPGALDQPYTFQSDYLVLDEPYLADYAARYMDSAPLWGKFSHVPTPPLAMQPPSDVVIGHSSITLPTAHHRQAFSRYVQARSAFDRFLKLYHCLELLFDYVILKQMKAVGDDLAGFGRIISLYGVNEIERLKHLIANYCDDKLAIFPRFYPLSCHEEKSAEIFRVYSKSGNPLPDEPSWQKFMKLCAEEQLTEAKLKHERLATDQGSRDKLATNLSAYFIYRIRSSIAHSKVGEFLFLDSDEELIVNFAEPLLLEIVIQVFSNQNLKATLKI